MDYAIHPIQRREPNRAPTRAGALMVAMALLCVSFGPAPRDAFGLSAQHLLTDQNMAQETEARLASREEVSFDSIDVETRDGIVTLSGSVRTILAKDLTTDIARSVRGVRAVVNHLTVTPTERDDAAIREDITDALREDPATESFEATLWVDNGAVVLTGTVDSRQEKDLIEVVAKGVRGVRAIDNRMAVRPGEERFDSEIQAEIEQILRWNVHVDDSLIAVAVRDGTVRLAGVVRSLMEKAEAIDTARGVRGVGKVEAEELEVADLPRSAEQRRREKFDQATNEEIAQTVKSAFARDPRLEPFNLDVSVRDGIATLTGVVTHYEAKRAAERDARNVVGVWRVRNLVKVRPRETSSDEQIEAYVRRWLDRDPVVDAESIETVVRNGVVRLTGSVGSHLEEARAISAASRARGAIDVEDHLQVRASIPSAQDKEDWEIRQDILSRLYWSPFVDRDAVLVEVEDGVATLSGTVDTWPQRQAATDSALAAGAERVRNELRVRYGIPGFVSGEESEGTS